MAKKKSQKFKIIKLLQIINLGVFLSAIATITILHTITYDFWDFLRLPQFIKSIDPLLGAGWPASLHVYQSILLISIFLVFLNGLGLFFYQIRLWRLISDITSFLGFLIIWPVALFFIYTMATADNVKVINFQQNLVYFGITFSLFLLDLITWFFDDQALLKSQK